MQVIGPDVYSTVPELAQSAVVEHMTAAGVHQEISAQWMTKADALGSSSAGQVVDEAMVQAQTMAVAHQNQAQLHEQCADYHRRAASLAESMNDSLDRVEARAQQQLASAKAWDWPKIIAEARAQAGQINSGFTATLGQRQAASMGSMAASRAAITALGAGTSAGTSMLSAGTGLGSVPTTGLGSMPPLTPVPNGPEPTPSPTPASSPAASSSSSSSTPQAAAPQTTPQAGPLAVPPGKPSPQPDPAAPDDDDPDDELGGDTGGDEMSQMLPELLTGMLTGVMGALTAIPQALSEAGNQLVSQASQGLSSLMDQTEPDDAADSENVELPASSSSGGSGGGGVSGGAGGAGGGGGEHLSPPATPAAAPANPVEQPPVGGSIAPAATAPAGGMPGMMPMGMGAGSGGGPTTAAADNKTRKVVTPHDPDTVDAAEPTVTVAVDNPSGSPPTLLRTLTRLTG